MSTTSSIPQESKSAKKRKAKADVVTGSTEAASPASEQPSAIANTTTQGANGVDSTNESPYVKELGRQIRNVHKKLSASSKADSVVAENPGKSLDDLLSEKKLNADQKAQLLKKPALQSQLAQLEEQISQYRSFAQEMEDRHKQEKASLIEAHEAELVRIKEEVATENEGAQTQSLKDALKIVSHFLHAAASKRQSEDADTEEGKAFEGALLLVYQGNEASLSTLKSLIDGSNDKVPDVQGEPLNFTFAQVKQSALREVQDSPQPTERIADELEPANESVSSHLISSDPTVANAGLTELEDTTQIPIRTNGAAESESIIVPEQASTGTEAANAVAESSWDPQASMTTDASAAGEEWVQVPRDPAETETGLSATPAATHGSTSWAEEVGAAAEESAKPENDGFEQVRRERGRGRARGGRGEFRGRGRGGGRGDGHRGRGGPPRGRGAPRGDKS